MNSTEKEVPNAKTNPYTFERRVYRSNERGFRGGKNRQQRRVSAVSAVQVARTQASAARRTGQAFRKLILSAAAAGFCIAASPLSASTQAGSGSLVIQVLSDHGPVEQAEIHAGEATASTNAKGEAVLVLPAGEIEIIVQRFGFEPAKLIAIIRDQQETRLTVELKSKAEVEEEITVTATRSERRIQDVPIRVEVIGHEEIEEKVLMTPGDIAMLLNETSGLRVQVTSPALGGANVRVQGLRGRYTQILADGLPLYGGQTGAIGLLQIPPMDLGQVEIIKGAASALYGSSALGGIINLVSRHPGKDETEREVLLNRTTRGGTDAVLWLSAPLNSQWGYTLLGGTHFQDRVDIDHDGWADLAGYRRALVRPRLFWEDAAGRSLFLTMGAMAEEREGGTTSGATTPHGEQFAEKLRTRRLDAAVVGQFLVGSRVVSLRAAVMRQPHRHVFGNLRERDTHGTLFAELSATGEDRGHTWVLGTAFQNDRYRSNDVPQFNYTYRVPALFAQDEYSPAPWFTLSASGRLDLHNRFGTFFAPRLSALLRKDSWTTRVSGGTGYFAPTPFIEETEVVGLSRLSPLHQLRPERARSMSVDVARKMGPVELNGTVFGSAIRGAVALRPALSVRNGIELVNRSGPTRTFGTEFLLRIHREPWVFIGAHTFIRSSEPEVETGLRAGVPLMPRQTATVVLMWEKEDKGRVGLEFFYTGRQRLENNPYRSTSKPYPFFGVLIERRLGRVKLFLNGENLTNVRQTRYDPLVRPDRNWDGRWTVDAWAPLEGRVINAGIRIKF